MQRKLDRWTTALSALLLLGALLACKKKTSVPSVASAEAPVAASAASAVAPVASAASAAPADAAPKLGEVKRYADKEKAQTGAVRIAEDGVKVFAEADDKTAEVATLNKGLLVFRLASIPDWELVEFPSGVGQVSPGWVLAKLVDTKTDTKAERDAVSSPANQALVKPASSAAPKSSASLVPSAKAAASTAKPVSSAAAAAAAKAAADKALADKAAADKAAADQAAADKAAANRAKRLADRAARAKRAADKAAAGQ